MFRTLLELVITIFVALIARSVITSLMRSVSSFSGQQSRQQQASAPHQDSRDAAAGPQIKGSLHKDPVCGTYVAETSSFVRRLGDKTYYYCSDRCRAQHDLVAR